MRSALAVLVLSGCGGGRGEPTESMGTDTHASLDECLSGAPVTWENFAQGFVQTWCTSCHSSTLEGDARFGAPVGLDLDTYDLVVPWGDVILASATVDEPRMPPPGGTSASDRALLAEWLRCGMPGAPDPVDPCTAPASAAGLTVASQSDADALCAQSEGITVTGGLTLTGDAVLDCVCTVDGDLMVSAQLHAPRLRAAGAVVLTDGAAVDLPVLESIGGLVVDGVQNADVALPRLLRVDGGISVQRNPGLVSLALPRLVDVHGDVSVLDNPVLADLSSFDSVEVVEGDITLSGNDTVTDLAVFSTLEQLGGDVDIGAHATLFAVSGFTFVESMAGSIRLHDLSAVRAGGFDKLVHLGGELRVTDCEQLTALDGFSRLETIDGSLHIERSPLLSSFASLGVLDAVGELVWVDNELATSLVGLQGLQTVDGPVVISGNGSLAAIGELDGLVTVGSLELSDNSGLASVAALHSLQNISGDLRVTDNPALGALEIDALVFAIDSGVGGTTTISGNGP